MISVQTKPLQLHVFGVEGVEDDVRQAGVAQDVPQRRLESQVPALAVEGLRQVEAVAL